MTTNQEERYIAKTDVDVCLGGHIRDVLAETKTLLAWLGYGRKYEALTGARLRPRLRRAALHHDDGKSDDWWQTCAEEDRLQEVGFRHELESLVLKGMEPTHEEVTPVAAAIAAHHGKLDGRHRDRWDGYMQYWKAFEQVSDQKVLQAAWDDLIRLRYEYDTVRGLLRLADQRASQIESSGRPGEEPPLPVRRFQYTFPRDYDGKRAVQKAAEDLARTEGLFDGLRAETGSGKTAAALLWAREHCRSRRAERVIFALPTRFTSTSLAEDVEAHLVQSGLYHSSAWQEIDEQSLQMSERFLQPVTVTTIDQVLSCLQGTSEGDRIRFANLAHSCLILDEVDFYDAHVQANLKELFRVLDVLEVPTLTMSATFPESHVDFYADQFRDKVQEGSQVKVQSLQRAADVPEVIVKEACRAEKSIVYANTVPRAAQYYDVVKSMRDDAILYHSRFTEPDKNRLQGKIKEMLGESGSGGVAVMTQVGEMSLNVTSNTMISDLCPIDRLAQRTGRLGRYSDRGDLHVIVPIKNATEGGPDDGDLYPAPYGELDTNGNWEASEKLTQTLSLLNEDDVLSKANLTDLTNQVYSGGVSLSREAERNAETLHESVAENWLVNPEGPPAWKARNLRPQIEVFVEEPKDEYDTWRSFQQVRLVTTVSVPSYWSDSRSEMLKRKTISVAGDEMEITHLADESDYSAERGLI